jgi:hypothetical protein
MIGVVDPLTAPLDQLLIFVDDDVTTPIFDAISTVTRPVTGLATRSTDGAAASAKAVLLSTSGPAQMVPAATMASTAPIQVEAGTPARRAIVRHGTRGAPAHGSGHVGLDPRKIPASPVPLPALPANSLGGTSTTASGSHEAGGVAVLSTPIARGAGIQPRISRAIGFTVRRLIVENPTVSPD